MNHLLIQLFSNKLAAFLLAILLGLPGLGLAPNPATQPESNPPPHQGESQNPPPTKQQTVLRVTTRLVQVNVIVQDKKGEPIADLAQEDFTLLDQGQPQSISVFSIESNRLLPVPAQPLPPNVFSNRLGQKSGIPTSVTVILLDGLNTRFEDMAYARQQIIKFLGQIQPQDRVALYTLTTHLQVLHDFTSDASSLLRALQRAQGHVSPELAASEPEPVSLSGNDALDEFLEAANQHVSDFYVANRAGRTANAIETIANHLASLPGRKNLVWVSGAFPFAINLDAPFTPANSTLERRTFSEEVDRAARALNNANMAIYPVDARGLIAPPLNLSGAPSIVARGRGGPCPPQISRISPPHENFDTMNILAERTGGRAFYNTNDIKGSIRKAIEDSRVTYVLGYYPAHNVWDGKFREVKVHVKRPGAHLYYRRGYFAFPEQPVDAKKREVLLRQAVETPLDATSLGLTVRVDFVDVPGAQALKTWLQVSPRDITLQPQGDRWIGSMDVLFVQRAADGKELTGEVRTLNMNLRKDSYDDIMKNGLSMTRNLSPAAGAASLRVVVRDATSGSVGSLSIPLTKLVPSSGS